MLHNAVRAAGIVNLRCPGVGMSVGQRAGGAVSKPIRVKPGYAEPSVREEWRRGCCSKVSRRRRSLGART